MPKRPRYWLEFRARATMNMPATCTRCGYSFVSGLIVVRNVRNAEIVGNMVSCDRCGGPARVTSGNYDIEGEVITALRAPGVTREKLEQMRAMAMAVQAGEVSASQAEAEIAQWGDSLLALWRLFISKGFGPGDLFGLLSLILAAWVVVSDSAEQRLDQARAETQQEVDRAILQELRNLRNDGAAPHSTSRQQGSTRAEQDKADREKRRAQRKRDAKYGRLL